MGEVPPPPGRDRDLGDRGAVMGVDHGAGRGRDGAVLGRQPSRQRKSSTSPAANVRRLDLDEMPSRGREQRLAPPASAQSGE